MNDHEYVAGKFFFVNRRVREALSGRGETLEYTVFRLGLTPFACCSLLKGWDDGLRLCDTGLSGVPGACALGNK